MLTVLDNKSPPIHLNKFFPYFSHLYHFHFHFWWAQLLDRYCQIIRNLGVTDTLPPCVPCVPPLHPPIHRFLGNKFFQLFSWHFQASSYHSSLKSLAEVEKIGGRQLDQPAWVSGDFLVDFSVDFFKWIFQWIFLVDFFSGFIQRSRLEGGNLTRLPEWRFFQGNVFSPGTYLTSHEWANLQRSNM